MSQIRANRLILAAGILTQGNDKAGFLQLDQDNKIEKPFIEQSNDYNEDYTKLESSPDGKYVVMRESSIIKVFDMSGEEPLELSVGFGAYSNSTKMRFNHNGTRFLIGESATDNLSVFDTSDWSLLFLQDINGTLVGADMTNDGLGLIWQTSTTPYIFAATMSHSGADPTVTVLATPTSNAASTSIKAGAFNLEGDRYILSSGNTTESTKEILAFPSGELLGLYSENLAIARNDYPRLSPNGSTWAISSNGGVLLVDTTSYIATNKTTFGTNSVEKTHWSDDTTLYMQSNHNTTVGGSQIYILDLETSILTDAFPGTRDINDFTIQPYSLTAGYEVTGTITETLANSVWRCSAYSLSTSRLINFVDTTSGTFSIPCPDSTAVLVMIHPVPAGTWSLNTIYALGDEVYPTNPDNTPFYYKCTVAGTSSASEPVWTTTPSGDTTDGTVTWTLVERIPQPVAHMPLTPTPVFATAIVPVDSA